MANQISVENDLPKTEVLRPPLFNLEILLVEDCEDNQFLFKRALVRKGAKVSLASDGCEGLEILGKRSFDCVLLDIQMPVMTGLEMMQVLKTREFKTPVIALTGFTREAEKTGILDAGFRSIVTKPIDGDLLVEAILQSINSGKKVTEAPLQ